MEFARIQKSWLAFQLLSILILGYHTHPAVNDKTDLKPMTPYQCSSDSLALTSNDLGFKLTRQIGGDDNLFISPLSIYMALAMTYLGAGGQTAKQLEEAFGLTKHHLNGTQLQESFKRLLVSIQGGNDHYNLLIANGLFIQENFAVRSEYIDAIRQIYQALVKKVNFALSGNQAVSEINNWVANKTENKIEKLLDTPLDPLTRLVLLNAVYFKGTWKIQFPTRNTEEGDFYQNSWDSKLVTMMQLHKETFRFYEDPLTNYKFVELPYKGDDIVMLLALPENFDSPADLEMNADLLCRVNSSMEPTELEDVIIPKFRLEYEIELNSALQGLGVKDLFVANSANLTGIRKKKDLFVSAVLHKAIIEVNEEGSEAAAVIGVILTPLSIRNVPTFVANHPFLFYIIDNKSGLVLFSGRVINP